MNKANRFSTRIEEIEKKILKNAGFDVFAF